MNLRNLQEVIKEELSQIRLSKEQHKQVVAMMDNVFSQLITRLENRKEGILLMEKAYQNAVKHGLTAYATESSRLLEIGHIYENNVRRSNIYKKRKELHIQQFHYEHKAQEYYNSTIKILIRTLGHNKDLINSIKKYIDEIDQWDEQYKTPIIFFHYYSLKLYYSQLLDSHEDVITNCNIAIKHFDKNRISATKAVHFTFRFTKIKPYICLKKYAIALQTIQDCYSLTRKRERNWHILSRMEVTIAFYQKNYDKAYQITQAAERYWKGAPPDIVEQWHIIKSYLQFLNDVNILEIQGRYNVGQFLKKLPIYSQDKTGNNVNILIISILLSLSRDRYNLVDRKTALTKYCNKHLSKNSRQALFMKMLLCCVTGKFQKAKVLELATKYQEQLTTDKNPEIELIPYEDLWEIIVKQLLD